MEALTTILTSAGATAIFLGAAVWLGRTWVDQQLKLRTNQQLERARSDLQGEMDALVRRRDVYASLAHAMRVFQRNDEDEDQEKRLQRRRQFLRAYDEVCLWGSEPVVNQLGELLDIVRTDVEAEANAIDSVQHDYRKIQAYQACMDAMRRDSGFPNTSFQYRVVDF